MPAPRLVSLKGSDFTGLGIEVYGGLKDGIFVKKIASQGPACGHINIGNYRLDLLEIPGNALYVANVCYLQNKKQSF